MYEIETAYDRKAMKALARAARKTVRKWSNIIAVVWGWIVVVFVALSMTALFLIDELEWNFWNVFGIAAAVFIFVCLIWQDDLNAWIGSRRSYQAGTEAKQIFQDGKYIMITPGVTGEWEYSTIKQFCETEKYFIFILDKNHGQIFDKAGFITGTPDAFRDFITGKTGLEARFIK